MLMGHFGGRSFFARYLVEGGNWAAFFVECIFLMFVNTQGWARDWDAAG